MHIYLRCTIKNAWISWINKWIPSEMTPPFCSGQPRPGWTATPDHGGESAD